MLALNYIVNDHHKKLCLVEFMTVVTTYSNNSHGRYNFSSAADAPCGCACCGCGCWVAWVIGAGCAEGRRCGRQKQ